MNSFHGYAYHTGERENQFLDHAHLLTDDGCAEILQQEFLVMLLVIKCAVMGLTKSVFSTIIVSATADIIC